MCAPLMDGTKHLGNMNMEVKDQGHVLGALIVDLAKNIEIWWKKHFQFGLSFVVDTRVDMVHDPQLEKGDLDNNLKFQSELETSKYVLVDFNGETFEHGSEFVPVNDQLDLSSLVDFGEELLEEYHQDTFDRSNTHEEDGVNSHNGLGMDLMDTKLSNYCKGSCQR